MNILLINDNPVVSRLLALCTRDEHIVLEEVVSIGTIQHESYDILFVDEGSYNSEVLNLCDTLNIGRKIFLSNMDERVNNFDMHIKKPFLPSQIIDILENVEDVNTILKESVQDVPSIFPLSTGEDDLLKIQELKDTEESMNEEFSSDTQVLDARELEKIKALLDMDDEIEVKDEVFSEEEIEQRKIEVIKEQLMAEGLEIVGEEEIVEELSIDDEVVIFTSEEKGKKKLKKKKSFKNKEKKSKKKKKKKSIEFTEEELEHIEDAVQVAIATLKRKQMKKLLKGKEIEISIKLEDKH